MNLKIIKSLFVVTSILLFSGCTITHKGLSNGEISEQSNLMISNDEIICKGNDDITILKGEIYNVGSLANTPYKSASSTNGMFTTISKNIYGHFPSHALALQGERKNWAITINENGDFLMDERNLLLWIGDTWALMQYSCKTTNNLKPFRKYSKE